MNKRLLVTVLSLIVLIGGAITVYGLTRPTDGAVSDIASSSAPSTTDSGAGASSPPAPIVDGAGVYVDYSETAIADAEGATLLFFHAPWCTQCRAVEADILSSGVPDGVTIIKVDYDSNQDLRQEYGVTLQTTFVEVDRAGQELQKFVAYDDPRLAAVVDAML